MRAILTQGTLYALLLSLSATAFADPPGSTTPTSAPSASPSRMECISCGTSKVGGHTLPVLQPGDFAQLVKQYAREELKKPGSKALETLLFHGRRARDMLETLGEGVLPPKHLDFLRREMARDHVRIAFRVVDEAKRVRLELDPIRVPLRVRKHLRTDRAVDVQHAEVSGTAVRVGLDRLWVRY